MKLPFCLLHFSPPVHLISLLSFILSSRLSAHHVDLLKYLDFSPVFFHFFYSDYSQTFPCNFCFPSQVQCFSFSFLPIHWSFLFKSSSLWDQGFFVHHVPNSISYVLLMSLFLSYFKFSFIFSALKKGGFLLKNPKKKWFSWIKFGCQKIQVIVVTWRKIQ